jgi:hypothetical protein
MTELRYRSFVEAEDLAIGECTVKTCLSDKGVRYWHMWARVLSTNDSSPLVFCVPIMPNVVGPCDGPGGKTWGLCRSGLNRWQITPSINVLESGKTHPGLHPDQKSQWHQTPALVEVPDLERWQLGGEP